MNDPANFRPISNLCTFSKLLERLALARLQPHVVNTGNSVRYSPLTEPVTQLKLHCSKLLMTLSARPVKESVWSCYLCTSRRRSMQLTSVYYVIELR